MYRFRYPENESQKILMMRNTVWIQIKTGCQLFFPGSWQYHREALHCSSSCIALKKNNQITEI